MSDHRSLPFTGPHAEGQRILNEFVDADTPAQEREVVKRYPVLMDRGAVDLLARLIERVQAEGWSEDATLLRGKRATLVRLQGGS